MSEAWGQVLFFTGVVSLVVLLGLWLFQPNPRALHRHRWTEWTDWVEIGRSYLRGWERRRRCLRCEKEVRQEVGMHNCWYAYTDSKRCPHRKQYSALFQGSSDRIKHLEKELFGG